MEEDEKETLALDFARLSSAHKSRHRIYGPEISKASRFSANEILEQVVKDVAMMREADVVGSSREIRNKASSIPLTSFATVVNYPEMKCEMQTFTDTEMLDAADGAEAVLQMMSHKGMTQLFDTSFYNKDNLFKETVNAADTSITAIMEASEVFEEVPSPQDVETSNKVLDNKPVESKTDKEPTFISDIVMIKDCKSAKIDDIKVELNEEMAEVSIENNFRKLRGNNETNFNFVTDGMEEESVKVDLVKSDTDNNRNNNEYKKVNSSIEEMVGFKEGITLEPRPPSPVLTPTIKFMKSGRGQNIKRKIYSLEAFEQVEASVNKKFRSQANFLNDEELCFSIECFNEISDCCILNHKIENNVVMTSDEECYQSQTKSVSNTRNNSLKSMDLLIDKCILKIPSQHPQLFEVLENENKDLPFDPPESEKPIGQTLINEEGFKQFPGQHENTKQETDNFTGKIPSQSIKVRNELNKETAFENTCLEFDVDFNEKYNLPSLMNTVNLTEENIYTKFSPGKNNETKDYDTIESMKQFLGFAPSNKNVGILNETQTNIQNTVNKTPVEKFGSIKLKEFTNSSNKSSKAPDESLPKMIFRDIERVHNMENNEFKAPTPKFQGFTTASNKSIKVSDDALVKTKTIFQDIEGLHHMEDDFDKNEELKSPAPEFQGFTTASNKNIKVSDIALAKTKTIFQDIEGLHHMEDNFDKNEELKSPPPKFQGFTTASNKNIKVSDEALAKTKMIFQDIEGLHHMEDDFDKNEELTSPPPKFQGFTTASNKNIKVSDEALTKTKTIFQDIEGLHHMEDDFDKNEELKSPPPKFQGFTTASNKNIKVSDEALTKTKTIFQDIEGLHHMEDDFDKNEELKLPSPEFQGFTTASNKNIKVSDETLAKTKTLFQDIEWLHCMEDDFDKNNEFKAPPPKIQGFTTASNKNIKVSDEALAKTKTLFQDIEGLHHMEDDFDKSNEFKALPPKIQGFTTASNKNIKVSDEALAKTKTLFQDIEGLHHMEDDFDKSNEFKALLPKIQGFTTASNKNIKVSDETLAKTKTLFQDIEGLHCMEDDFDKNNEFKAPPPKIQGFTTASNKNIKVSDEALAKTKTLFQDIEGVHIEDNFDGSKEFITPELKFEGFSTASNKTVKVSEEAIAYTKNMFQDSENLNNVNTVSNFDGLNSTTVKNIETSKEVLPVREKRIFEGFSSGNNKKIKVSETALKETKKLFKDVNIEESENIDKTNTISNIDLLNTQIKSHFEETLYTEDFCETPKKVTPVRNMKSGSPILPNSTAKRRVFKVPYRMNRKIEYAKTEKDENIESKPILDYNYDDRYKTNPEKRLKDLKISENEIFQHFDYNNIRNFRFSTNDLNKSELNVDAVKNIFLNSVNRKLVPEGWLDNHVKLILWKLLSYEAKFPESMCGVASPKNLLQQLKYRYDRELYKVERPVLRKILERDETAGRCMVLCVVRILAADGENESAANTMELELTDGWYCVRATIDRTLSKAVADGKITSGTKIITHGAELMNCEQGVAPWEDTSSVRLKLCGNSTRRVPWHTRLGLHPAAAVRVQLRTLTPEGGKVSAVRVYVARVYPLLFVERFEDGSTVTRSERLEALQASRHESERQARLDAIYQELERETATSESQEMSNAFRMIKYGEQESITASQMNRINEESSRRRDEMLEDIRRRVQEKIEKIGLDKMQRNIVPLLKIRICSWQDPKSLAEGKKSVLTKAYMSVWKPSESLLDVIKEGVWIDAMNVVPTAIRMSELHISAGRQSIFHKLRIQNGEKFSSYVDSVTRRCTRLADVRKADAPFNEVDLAGLVFQIEPDSVDFDKLPARNQNFQNVYLTDGDKNFACIHFWGGLRKFGFEKVIETGQFVSCANLQVRMGNSRKSIPQFRVTEFSVFTKVPRNSSLRSELATLKKEFENVDIESFCVECVRVKNTGNVENESPYRINSTDHNLSKNKVFLESPYMQNVKSDLNLTGLDFESTFKLDSQLTEAEALRRSRLKSKMEKLKIYGEPPPLTPMHMRNKSRKVDKAYVSPVLKSNSCRENVASANERSPVLKCRREANPVRLNFARGDDSVAAEKQEGASEKDFSEEFEYSPPLSLDGEYF